MAILKFRCTPMSKSHLAFICCSFFKLCNCHLYQTTIFIRHVSSVKIHVSSPSVEINASLYMCVKWPNVIVNRICALKMSQQQQQQRRGEKLEPIRYGDVFNVAGELASSPIAPRDADMMQTAETSVLGQTKKGGAAAVMQSAAAQNERAGFVSHSEVSDAARERGVTVTESELRGSRIVTESIAGQVVEQYVEAAPVTGKVEQSVITIGQALEATANTAGNKPVEHSDAAAIQAAEIRATGSNDIQPGGVAAMAMSAASFNAQLTQDEDKIKLNDVLMGASRKLPADKAVTRQDAVGVVMAELRNNPRLATYPGGVADSISTAARLNENLNV